MENVPGFADAFKQTQVLVLDEADTLLDMGFRDDIEAVTEQLPPKSERQTFLFSATVSPAIHQIATKTMDKHHTFVNTVSDDSSPVHAHIPQYHTILPDASEQIPHLLRLITQDQLENVGKSKIIVFLPTTKMTQLYTTLLRSLKRDTLPAGVSTEVYEIHSKKSQESRTSTSNNFRKDVSGASVLVTSDVSARGVDYPNVTRVIQIGIPGSAEQYVHRVGRTGRRDLAGRGDLILLPWEAGFVTHRLADVPIKPLTTEELAEQVDALAAKVDAEGLPRTEQPQEKRTRLDPRSRDRDRWGGPRVATINTPVSPAVSKIEPKVKDFVQELDPQAVDETFVSVLGYYFGKTAELRCEKEVILQGCRDWTVSAMGLSEPPYVSKAFLEKIGFSEPRRRQPRDGPRNFGGGGGRGGMMPRPRFGMRKPQESDGSGVSEGSEFGSRSGGSRFSFRSRRSDSDSDDSRPLRPRTSSWDRDARTPGGDGNQRDFRSRSSSGSRRPALDRRY